MAANNLDVYMVKAMCSNVKMEFDLAKANFLEIQEAMETFHGYLKRMEQMEKQNPNNSAMDGELAHLKDAVNRAKENMSILRGKLAKNTNRAEEGYRLLMDRLHKVEEKMDELVTRKRKSEDLHTQYKRLRLSTSRYKNGLQQQRNTERQTKMQELECKINEDGAMYDSTKKEKQVLREACDKMQVFLEDTKGVLDHFKDASCIRKRDGIHLLKWVTNILSNAGLHLIREHSINDTEVAFEYLNLPTMSFSCPRLVLTATFVKQQRGPLPYAVISIKANIESLPVSDLIDEAIEQNSVINLLTKVQVRWADHVPLLNEIVQLRDKFAIDWLVEQNRLRLMLGHSGNIICTLIVPRTYPHSGVVSLEHVNGIDLEKDVSSYKPTDGDMSITGWLNYLNHTF